jgi:hypothetical protein
MVMIMASGVVSLATSEDLSVKGANLLGRVLMGRSKIKLPDFDR